MLIFVYVLKQRRRDVQVTRIHQSLLSPLLFQTLPHNNESDIFKIQGQNLNRIFAQKLIVMDLLQWALRG